MTYFSGGNQLIDAVKTLKRAGVFDGMKVADLGCGGAGHFVIPAARLVGSKGMAYAVDILRSVLDEVAKKARLDGVSNLKTIWANLETYHSVKLADNILDIAFLINILFQSKEHLTLFQEAKRLLKKGGKLLVIDWNKTSAPFGPPLVDRVSSKEVKSLAGSLGLTPIDEFVPGKYHFAVVFIK